MVALLICLGVWLRLHAFGFPSTFQFDEHHFVENARNYLAHRADWNDHPPLGKLILALSLAIGGDNSVAWRLPSLVFGFVTIAAGGVAAARLFRSAWAGCFAAAFLSADGFLVAYSRAALLDGFLAASAALTLLLCSFELSLATSLMAGVLLAFSVSIKFSGLAVAVPLLVAWGMQQERWSAYRVALAGSSLLVAAVISMMFYRYGLALAHQPHGLMDVAVDVRRLVIHHSQLTDMKNPATSGWITWALPTRPLRLGTFEQSGMVRVLTTLGNVALWWPAVSLGAVCVWTTVKVGADAVLGTDQGCAGTQDSGHPLRVATFIRASGRAVFVCLITALAFLSPWVISHRDSYLYHFLPSYTALVILLAGFVAWVRRRSSWKALTFTVVVLLVAACYAPIWTYLPISERALDYRLFLPSWR